MSVDWVSDIFVTTRGRFLDEPFVMDRTCTRFDAKTCDIINGVRSPLSKGPLTLQTRFIKSIFAFCHRTVFSI